MYVRKTDQQLSILGKEQIEGQAFSMKLRDCVFLLLVLDLPLSSMTNIDCKTTTGSELGFTIALRVADTFTNWIGVPNPFSHLWIVLDIMSSPDDFQQLMINCNLKKYHSSKVFQNLKGRDQDINRDSSNLFNLEKIRLEIESTINMQEIITDDPSTRAAVYPLLTHWAVCHLKVYRLMIGLIGTEKACKYKEKHDEWVVYYVQLLLRYWRPYKKQLLMWNSQDYSSKAVIQNPAENLLLKWIKWPYNYRSQNKISNMLESCKVKKGDVVMFNALQWVDKYIPSLCYTCTSYFSRLEKPNVGEQWWSCWDSNEDNKMCKTQTCPAAYGYKSPFNYNTGFRYNFDCKGELFWIYSNSAEIRNGHTVNIKYNERFWVSTFNKDGELENIERCPGRTFRGINNACHGENIRITKKKIELSQEVIYDGNLITMCRTGKNCKNVFDIYSYGSETLEYEAKEKPIREFLEGYVEEILSGRDGVMNQTDQVILKGGRNNAEGNVLLWSIPRQKFMPVCDDHWDRSDAIVVCKSLGFTSGTSTTTSHFGKEGSDFIMDDVKCLGNETSIWNCPHTTNENCEDTESAGVRCESVKLSGGSTCGEGNVLVLDPYKNRYMPVCDDSWTREDAKVVCKMLGFSSVSSITTSSHFGNLGANFIMDDVKCTGSELSIWDCPRRNTTHNCVDTESAGVKCIP